MALLNNHGFIEKHPIYLLFNNYTQMNVTHVQLKYYY